MTNIYELNTAHDKLQTYRRTLARLNAHGVPTDDVYVVLGTVTMYIPPCLFKNFRESAMALCHAEIERLEGLLKQHGITP